MWALTSVNVYLWRGVIRYTRVSSRSVITEAGVLGRLLDQTPRVWGGHSKHHYDIIKRLVFKLEDKNFFDETRCHDGD